MKSRARVGHLTGSRGSFADTTFIKAGGTVPGGRGRAHTGVGGDAPAKTHSRRGHIRPCKAALTGRHPEPGCQIGVRGAYGFSGRRCYHLLAVGAGTQARIVRPVSYGERYRGVKQSAARFGLVLPGGALYRGGRMGQDGDRRRRTYVHHITECRLTLGDKLKVNRADGRSSKRDSLGDVIRATRGTVIATSGQGSRQVRLHGSGSPVAAGVVLRLRRAFPPLLIESGAPTALLPSLQPSGVRLQPPTRPETHLSCFRSYRFLRKCMNFYPRGLGVI
ncbi:hypothetical protein Bbelb_172880 [Branchiostoma belcheri]|nr:hypothetical protein Bbelb_172880 [Branchiostoma belcheri]